MRFKFVAALALCASSTMASAQQITSPTAGYLSSTTLFAIPGDYSNSVSQLTSGGLTLTFSGSGNKVYAPGGGWLTWSSSPESERSGALDVLYFSGQTSVTMTLNRKVGLFGFEAEPNPFALLNYSASFYNGASLVGTVTRDIDGTSGARLFAYQGEGIDRIEFSGPYDFAAGAFRFADVPEPSSVLLTISGLVGLAVARRRRRA